MPKPLKRLGEVARGLGKPSEKELERTLVRASKATTFRKWDSELFRQSARIASKQVLRVMGGTTGQKRSFMREAQNLAIATGNPGGLDKITSAASLRNLKRTSGPLRIKVLFGLLRHARDKTVAAMEGKQDAFLKWRNSVGLPPDSEIRELILRCAKIGDSEKMSREVVRVAAKHAFTAIGGKPELMKKVVKGVVATTFDNADEGREAMRQVIEAVGKDNFAMFTEVHARNAEHIKNRMDAIVEDILNSKQ